MLCVNLSDRKVCKLLIYLSLFLDNLDLEFEDESQDEDFSYDQEDKRTLRNFVFEHPYTEEKITQLIEIFRKHRVSILFYFYVKSFLICIIKLEFIMERSSFNMFFQYPF